MSSSTPIVAQRDDTAHGDGTSPRRIAIIGAGISGIATAAHILQHNKHRHQFEVTVFERSDFVGGVWEYDERHPLEPGYPNDVPPAANPLPVSSSSQERPRAGSAVPGALDGGSQPETTEDYDTAALIHAPPGPAYKGLKNNVPTSLMYSSLQAWPEGTEEFVDRELIAKYIRDLADSTRARDHVVLNTSVESISKHRNGEADGQTHEAGDHARNGDSIYRGKWTVRTKTLVQPARPGTTGSSASVADDGKAESSSSRKSLFTYATHEFDAVVVASGHYHIPRLPELPGLQAWRDAYPGSVSHAKGYRTPDRFPGSNVLIIGSSASSHDIAKELSQAGKTVYVSSRGGQWDIGAPEPAIKVGEILEFAAPAPAAAAAGGDAAAEDSRPKSRTVRLKDGTLLHDIDHVILATGYLTSYPFLGPRLQDPAVPAGQAGDEIVVTRDGLLTHNLHRDIWYIPDPSLAFVGVVFHTSTFSMFDFQAAVVARVLAGFAQLPAREEMREEYVSRKRRVLEGAAAVPAVAAAVAIPAKAGDDETPEQREKQQQQSLRSFHSLMGRETVYIDEILAWANTDARRLGVPEMPGLSDKWHRRYEEFREQIKARRAALGSATTGGVVFGPLGRLQREEEQQQKKAEEQGDKDKVGTEDGGQLRAQSMARQESFKRTQAVEAETQGSAREEAYKKLKSEAAQAVRVVH